MQSWWFVFKGVPPMVNSLLIVVPATVFFAWVFYVFCEKPYMRTPVRKVARSEKALKAHSVEDYRAEDAPQVFAQTMPAMADEI
jgi:peptidoglycan/LPS O-acetylase OafA/YrhL